MIYFFTIIFMLSAFHRGCYAPLVRERDNTDPAYTEALEHLWDSFTSLATPEELQHSRHSYSNNQRILRRSLQNSRNVPFSNPGNLGDRFYESVSEAWRIYANTLQNENRITVGDAIQRPIRRPNSNSDFSNILNITDPWTNYLERSSSYPPYSTEQKSRPKTKHELFRSKLPKKKEGIPSHVILKVRRQNIFEDSYRAITELDGPEHLRGVPVIKFEGEVGIDRGGLRKEWFSLLAKQLFHPMYGLFKYGQRANYNVEINPFSHKDYKDDYRYFAFAGLLTGMAIYHKQLLGIPFSLVFLKNILGQLIQLEDLKHEHSEFYNAMMAIKDNKVEDLGMGLTFVYCEQHSSGMTLRAHLKRNGDRIPVTDKNKKEYIRLSIKYRFETAVSYQASAFRKALSVLIPLDTLNIFTPIELGKLISGAQRIDVKDWEKYTKYQGYDADSDQIQWFWTLVKSMDNKQRQNLLKFVTGSEKTPSDGFKYLRGDNGYQKFTIQKSGTPDMLPVAHTCFNRLDLPPYKNFEELKKRLTRSVSLGRGFFIA